ncbi:MAG: hypothetical protein ACI8Y4_002314 [Candidatus Poriferisodalaceae bacterium]
MWSSGLGLGGGGGGGGGLRSGGCECRLRRVGVSFGGLIVWLFLDASRLLLGGRLLLRWSCRLFGLFVTNEPLALGLAAHTIGLWLNNTRRVALDANTQRVANVEGLLVGET